MQEGAGVRQIVEDELRRPGIRLRDLDVRLELGLQESVRSAVAGRLRRDVHLAHGGRGRARGRARSRGRASRGSTPRARSRSPRATGRAPTRVAEAFVEFARERLAS